MLGQVGNLPNSQQLNCEPLCHGQTNRADSRVKTPKVLFETQLENSHSRCHYESVLTPKTEDHMRFLLNCARFQGNLNFGRVHANLDPRFWSFVNSIDESVIVQSYIDAVLLSGEYSCVSADSKTLIEESGVGMDLTAEQMKQITQDQISAKNCLKLIHEKKSNSCSPFKGHVSRSLRRDYFVATSGGELKKEYAIYCRAQKFKDKLLAIAEPNFITRSQSNMQKLLQHSGQDAKNVVIALSRLQRLHDQHLTTENGI